MEIFPFDTEDIISYSQKKIPQTDKVTIVPCSRIANLTFLKGIPYIEHTGNESQSAEDYYHAAVLIVGICR